MWYTRPVFSFLSVLSLGFTKIFLSVLYDLNTTFILWTFIVFLIRSLSPFTHGMIIIVLCFSCVGSLVVSDVSLSYFRWCMRIVSLDNGGRSQTDLQGKSLFTLLQTKNNNNKKLTLCHGLTLQKWSYFNLLSSPLQLFSIIYTYLYIDDQMQGDETVWQCSGWCIQNCTCSPPVK